MSGQYYLKWPMTAKCNSNCIFCNNKKMRSRWKPELTESELEQFIDYLNSNTHICGITLSGGEPTIADNFEQFCKKNKIPFGFITSGTAPLENISEALKNKALTFITVSIDCLESDTVKKIRQSDVIARQLEFLSYITKYKEQNKLNFKIYINTVVNKYNFRSIIPLIERILSMRGNRIQLFRFSSTGDPSIDRELQLTLDDEVELTRTLIEYYIANEQKILDSKFELLLRYMPYYAQLYWEKVFDRKLNIFRASSCGIIRNTLYLKTDTTLNLCPCYRENEYYSNELRKKRLYEINILDLMTKTLEDTKQRVLSLNNYSNYFPCANCPQLLTKCRPCVGLADGENIIEFEDCMCYYKLLQNIHND